MDPILQLPPELPPHQAAPLAIVQHQVIAEWPVGTFLENLAVLDKGDMAVAVLSEARIDRVTHEGAITPLIVLPAPAPGLAVLNGAIYAAVGEPGGAEPWLWRIDPDTGLGEPHTAIAGGIFANGLARFDDHRLLVSDSWQGRLYLVDVNTGTCTLWAEDERLTGAHWCSRSPSRPTKLLAKSVWWLSTPGSTIWHSTVMAELMSRPTSATVSTVWTRMVRA